MTEQIQTVAVVGTGLIGASWAACFLAHGLRVQATDPAEGAESKLLETVEKYMPVATGIAGKGPASDWKERLKFTQSLEECIKGAQFVQENGPERIALKHDLYAKLDAIASPSIIIASSSSGISATAMSQVCKHKERILVCHPFYPPHILPLVEIVPALSTNPSVTDQAIDFFKSLGKKPVLVQKEVAGFVGNRLQAALVQEAIHLLETGVASAEDIDAVVTTGMGPRWALLGPFMNMQMAGGVSHFLRHIGPAFETYWREMGRVDLTPELIESVSSKVEFQTSKYNVGLETIKQERDQLLFDLLKAKSASDHLV